MESTQEKFYRYPYKNPKTKKKIEINGKEYKKLVNKYGEPPKIKSPVTGSKIGIGKGEYNKLIKQGYTDKELISGAKSPSLTSKVKESKVTKLPSKVIKSPIKESNITAIEIKENLNQDMMREILLRSNIEQLSNLCLTNKYNEHICQSESFWQEKLKYDGLPSIEFIDHPFEEVKETYFTESDIITWFNIYKDLKEAQDEAKLILLINEIEKTRLNNQTNGMFIVQKISGNKDPYYIPKSLQDDIIEKLKIKIDDYYKLEFHLLDNEYKLVYVYAPPVHTLPKTNSSTTLTMKETLDILTLILVTGFRDEIDIHDDDFGDFRYLPAKLAHNTSVVLKERYTLYEAIEILTNKGIMKKL